MRSFELFLDDDRYGAPAVVFVMAADEAGARARASEILLRSPHHVGVEVWSARRRLFAIGRGHPTGAETLA